MSERVVLAYSGGLDTSVAIGWTAGETGAAVVAVAVGQGGEDLEAVRKRAPACADDSFDQRLAGGFGQLLGLPSKIAARRTQRV